MVKRTMPSELYAKGMDNHFDDVFNTICRNIKISLRNDRFVHFIDEDFVMDTTKGYRWENLTPDYEKILLSGLRSMMYTNSDCAQNSFCKSYNETIKSLLELIDRIIDKLKETKPENFELKIGWFENMKEKRALNFEEAIQRFLFLNQIFWQTDFRLVGLGAWDTILYHYFGKEIENFSEVELTEIIGDLFSILHNQYTYKSNVLMGDTGQIFVLGKSDRNGSYICNRLTYLFIKTLSIKRIPDPKILLRVNKNTPVDLIKLAVECIQTGVGSPLFANDDIIIPSLTEFGIDERDACEYTTSACWEPLIGGKSSSMNNMTVLNFLRPLDRVFKRENLAEIKTFDDFFSTYLKQLKNNIKSVKRILETIRFQYNPLLSVFTKGCYESKKDVSEGGAIYKHVGITSVALGNLIDSMFYIKELVFDKQELTLLDIKKMIFRNFEEEEVQELYFELLKSKESFFGKDEHQVIDMCNQIISFVSENTEDYRNYLGGKLKFGISGSAYMDAAREFPGSFDGRKWGQPFKVHISNEDNAGYTEVMNFASKIDYSRNRFNGNVADLMVSPCFIEKNIEKFVEFIHKSIKNGFFEMQMNVVSSEVLVDAKHNPESHTGLIVRVWGFSAYFNDLPEDYKEVLIERAKKNEQKLVG